MKDANKNGEGDGDVTADEESVQGDSDREEDMARVFGGGRNDGVDEGDVTEDEEL